MVIETWLDTDLSSMVEVVELHGNIFSADNGGNLIGVRVTKNYQDVTLNEAIHGYVIRNDGATVILEGSYSGNKASVVLNASCYTIVGPISIVIKSGNTTIGACHGYVYPSTTDAIVDPGHIIPSISELLAQIEACRQATNAANGAASSANTAAGAANTAAGAANTAATKIDEMTVAAQTLPSGSSATATVSDVDGHKHILFGLVKGDPGKDFRISKTFASIAAMEAYTGTDVLVNDCVMIDTGSVEDVDTGKLYRRTENGWSYIGDLSGKQGIKGDTGNGIASAVLNQDYTLTITFTDGTSYTTTSIRGAQGPQGSKGDTGDTGAAGPAGPTGQTGATPNMTIGTVQTLTPGSPATASITGTPEDPVLNLGIPKGDPGSASNMYGSTIPMSPQDQTTVATAISGKVSSSQGSANAGKVLGIDQNGSVLPVPFNGDDFTGATASTAGVHGYVPAPAAGDQEKILTGDGTWKTYPGARIITVEGTVSNTSGAYTGTFNDSRVSADMAPISINLEDSSVFGGSISITTGAGFITITCSDVAGESDFAVDLIKADFNGTTVTSEEFDLLNASKLDKNQGSANAGKALGIDSTGAVVPVPFSGEDFTGATASTAGVHGYVPAPSAGDQSKYLKGDGTWSEVPNPQVMTGATASAAGTSGLVPAPAIAEREKFLCGDGTWAIPEGGKLVSFDLDTVTNTSGSYTHTTVLSDVTHDMKAVMIEVSNPDAFNDQIHVLTADGSVTLTCDDVAGTSDVTISCLFVANPSPITSSEFDVLANRIGTLASLQTTAKSDLVSAINETVGSISTINGKIGNVGSTDLQSQVDSLNSKITNVETVHNPAGYDTSILEDVYAVRRGNAVLVTLRIKSGLSADWHNDIVTGLPPRFRPPVQVFGSHRIASGADVSKNIIIVLTSDGLTQFNCSAIFNVHIDCSFSFVALND